MHPRPVDDGLPAWKRTIDLLACVAALPLLVLCTTVMAVIMKLVSPGPVLFRQERVGYKGKRYRIYKFRTMHVRAATATHHDHFKELVRSNAPMVKLDARGDSRLIPGAWLLRALGLDELPQIINVLRGEMSLVGPRPCLPGEAELYQPWQQERFDACPGLTGLWQVSGKNRTTFEEMMRLDIRYVRNRTLWMDLRIIARTVPALLAQVYETRSGRRSTVAAASVPPFSALRDREGTLMAIYSPPVSSGQTPDASVSDSFASTAISPRG